MTNEAKDQLPEWCPQWAWDEAYRLASQVVAERGTRMETFQPIVARALLAAEQRGLEKAAKVALTRSPDDDNLDWQVRQQVAAAIRQLGEEP